MHKAGKYTLLTAILALIFIVLSILCGRILLGNWEEKLLGRSGRLEYTSPVRSGEETEDGSQAARDNRLQMEEIEDIVRVWNQKSVLLVHEPAEGQISIDEAIEEVKSWLSEIGMEETAAGGSGSIQATLNQGQMKGKKKSQQGPGYSFWRVEYVRDEVEAVFFVNAITGRVWEADVTFYKPWPKKPDADFLDILVDLTGLKASEEDRAVKLWENEDVEWYGTPELPMKSGYAEAAIQDSLLKAQLYFGWIQTAGDAQSGAEESVKEGNGVEESVKEGNGVDEGENKDSGSVDENTVYAEAMAKAGVEKVPWLQFDFQLQLEE